MAQSVSQIRSEIESTKEHMAQTVSELEERVQELRRWPQVVQQYPLPSVLVAFGLGFFFTGAFKVTLLRSTRNMVSHAFTAALTGIMVQQLQQRVGVTRYRM